MLLLIDARRGVMDSDQQVMELLDQAAVSYGLVLTKIDELKPAERADALRRRRRRGRASTPPPWPEVQLTSAQTGDGHRPACARHLAALAAIRLGRQPGAL